MKRNAIARIIICSLLALVLTGILVSGLLTNFVIDISSGTVNVVNSEAAVNAEQVHNLQINWLSGNVVIKAEAVDRIILRETADNPIKKPMTYRCEDNTLEIDHSNQRVFGPFYRPQEKNLVVIVPLDWECRDMEIDGVGLEISINDLNIRDLSVDGAGVVLNVNSSIQDLNVDGAGCEVTLNCTDRPKSIEMDGAGCVLSLTLPDVCGFQLEMDGLGCELETDLPFRKNEGLYLSGDGYCNIEVNGLGCEVNIQQATSNEMAYSVRCGDDFTAGLLLEPLDAEYAPGTVITLKTEVLTEVDLELYVNGRFACTQTEHQSAGGAKHWEFQFTMLNEPVVIHFSTVDGIER